MYKKLSFFLAFILVIILFAACSTPQAEADKKEPFDNRFISVSIDKETGCEYIVFERVTASGGGAGGITPRLTMSGKPLCRAENQTQ